MNNLEREFYITNSAGTTQLLTATDNTTVLQAGNDFFNAQLPANMPRAIFDIKDSHCLCTAATAGGHVLEWKKSLWSQTKDVPIQMANDVPIFTMMTNAEWASLQPTKTMRYFHQIAQVRFSPDHNMLLSEPLDRAQIMDMMRVLQICEWESYTNISEFTSVMFYGKEDSEEYGEDVIYVPLRGKTKAWNKLFRGFLDTKFDLNLVWPLCQVTKMHEFCAVMLRETPDNISEILEDLYAEEKAEKKSEATYPYMRYVLKQFLHENPTLVFWIRSNMERMENWAHYVPMEEWPRVGGKQPRQRIPEEEVEPMSESESDEEEEDERVYPAQKGVPPGKEPLLFANDEEEDDSDEDDEEEEDDAAIYYYSSAKKTIPAGKRPREMPLEEEEEEEEIADPYAQDEEDDDSDEDDSNCFSKSQKGIPAAKQPFKATKKLRKEKEDPMELFANLMANFGETTTSPPVRSGSPISPVTGDAIEPLAIE